VGGGGGGACRNLSGVGFFGFRFASSSVKVGCFPAIIVVVEKP
jgi:hypothetical protein